MLTFKVLSVLLSYPSSEALDALDEMAQVLTRERVLPSEALAAVSELIEVLSGGELIDLQEQYVELFDRGRHLSLHLFEHVHGESRDRGQAMVDLMEEYRRNGFELAASELPDYVPLFFEYLAHRPAAEARSLLADAMPTLSLLGARLAERDSIYRAIFAALEAIAGVPEGIDDIRKLAATEGPDQMLVNMDDIWEEEAVTFGGAAPPPPHAGNVPSTPVRWVDSATASAGSPADPGFSSRRN